MDARRLISIGLAGLALGAAALLATEVAVRGTPSFATVIITAILVGSAAAWPVASRSERRPEGPGCGDCGYPSWSSVDLGFCIHCGSQRIWSAPQVVR